MFGTTWLTRGALITTQRPHIHVPQQACHVHRESSCGSWGWRPQGFSSGSCHSLQLLTTTREGRSGAAKGPPRMTDPRKPQGQW